MLAEHDRLICSGQWAGRTPRETWTAETGPGHPMSSLLFMYGHCRLCEPSQSMLYTKGSARTPFNTTDTMLCDPCSEQKNCAISHPLLNEGTCIREYSTIRPIRHISFKSFQCLLSSILIVEYSRMHFPSLSSGCEIAQFFCSSYRLRLTPSSCYHHPVKSGTSEWELHQDTQILRHIFVLSCCDSVSSTGASRYQVSWHACSLTRLARMLFNTTGTHAL